MEKKLQSVRNILGGDDVIKANPLLDMFFNGFKTEDEKFCHTESNEKEAIITAEIPGVEKSDISLTIKSDTILTIEAKRTTPEKSYSAEYKFDNNFDITKLSAVYCNGILKIVVPKVEIPINEIKVQIN